MICRLSLVLLCSPFSAVKMGAPFSLRRLTPLSFHGVPTIGILRKRRLGCFASVWMGLQRKKAKKAMDMPVTAFMLKKCKLG